MRTLVISDTHLNGFEEKKFNLLKRIISDVDRVILNGDFWEGYDKKYSFDKFISSPWKALFPLLKSRNAIYLYGNHDRAAYSDDRTSLFSVEQKYRYEMNVGKTTYIFEHGNRLCPFFDDEPNQLYKPDGFLMFLIGSKVEKPLTKILHPTGMKKLGKKYNKRIKKRLQNELKSSEIYFCGHTHVAEIDRDNNFVNSGFIKHGFAQYLILEGENIIAKEEKYA